MKTVYLDTSVVVSPYHPGDPYQAHSLSILTSQVLTKTISHIGLIELSATVSRLRVANEIQLPTEVESTLSSLDFSKQVYSILLFMLKRGDVKVLVPDIIVTLNLEDLRLNLSSIFVEAFNLAPRTLLKTLDNLHVASLHSLLKEGHSIHYMVTGDEEILKARKNITKLTNVPVTSPSELIELEPLR